MTYCGWCNVGWCAGMLIAIALGIYILATTSWPLQRALSVFQIVSCLLLFTAKAWPLVINAKDGCYPWSPKEVPFRQGMTLCPGQSAVVTIEFNPDLPVPPKAPDKPN